MFKLIPNSVWAVLEQTVAEQRADLRIANERIAALAVALGRKNDVTVSMPIVARERVPLERSEGYFDSKPIPAISTPAVSSTGGTKK